MTVTQEGAHSVSINKQQDLLPIDQESVGAMSPEKLVELFRSVVEEAIQKIDSRAALSSNTSDQPNQGVPFSKTGLDLKTSEKLKAADLRIAFLMGRLPENSGLLIDTAELATLLSVSRAMVCRLQATGSLPKPIKLGRLTKWRAAEIVEWIEADCPNESMWNAIRQSASRRGKR